MVLFDIEHAIEQVRSLNVLSRRGMEYMREIFFMFNGMGEKIDNAKSTEDGDKIVKETQSEIDDITKRAAAALPDKELKGFGNIVMQATNAYFEALKQASIIERAIESGILKRSGNEAIIGKYKGGKLESIAVLTNGDPEDLIKAGDLLQ